MAQEYYGKRSLCTALRLDAEAGLLVKQIVWGECFVVVIIVIDI